MNKATKRVTAIILSLAMVFTTSAFSSLDLQVKAAESLVTAFSYDFAYTTPGYADGTIYISASEDGVYRVFWGDAEGNRLKKDGYEYSYLARVIVKNGTGSYNIISDYTAIPEGAKTVLVYRKDALQYTYDIPKEMLFGEHENSYTFGALSDPHYGRYARLTTDDAVPAMERAMDFLDGIGIDFVGISGDLTAGGEQTSLDKYNAVLAKHPDVTVLTAIGNHDSKTTISTTDEKALDTSISRWYNSIAKNYFTVEEDGTVNNNLKYEILANDALTNTIDTQYRAAAGEEPQDTTVPGLDFVTEVNGNIMIFFNEIAKTGETYDTDKLVTTGQMDWLEEQLETYKDRNVFVFFHSFLCVNTLNGDAVDYNNCVGDLKNEGGYSYDLDMKDVVTTSDGLNMQALFNKYSNAVMLSGHSHWQYAMQELNANLNIARLKGGQGGTLIHLSSVSSPRYIGDTESARTDLNGYASEGTTVTVYDDCIVYNSVDFYNSQYEAYATYIVPTGENSKYEPVKNSSHVDSTSALMGSEYLEAEDMTDLQLLKSDYNLALGAGYVYSSKGAENTDGALTDGSASGTFMNTKANKKKDQFLIITLDGQQKVSNLKNFMIYFVNGLTDSATFHIELSQDGEHYESAGDYTGMTYTDIVLEPDVSGLSFDTYKYVKINLTAGAKAYGYQIREFAIIGYEKNETPNTAGSACSLVEGEIDEEDYLNTDYNLVFGAEYTQSSVGTENGDGKLTDGTLNGFANTQWSSSAKKQEFVIDLGKAKIQDVSNIDYFLLYSQNAATNVTAFNVQLSLDGETYETVGTYSGVDIDTNHFDPDLENVTLERFRYVRFNVTNGNTNYGYQIKEFAVIGVNPIEYPEIADQSANVSNAEKNIALNKTVIVSSTYEKEGSDPTVLTDGKKDKYWSSDWNNKLTSDYIIIDLGSEYDASEIGSVLVNYKNEATFCGDYTIEVSDTYNEEDPAEGFYEIAKTKAASWDIVQKYSDANGYVVTPVEDVASGAIRYVKIHMNGHKGWGFQVYEVAVLATKSLTSPKAELISQQSYVYSGTPQELELSVSYDGKALTKDKDYTVTYENNVNVGTATATVKGIGDYSGEVVITFTIEAEEIAGAEVEATFDENNNLVVTLKDGDKELVEGEDYTYTTETDELGNITITVTAAGTNHTGTFTTKINAVDNPNRPAVEISSGKAGVYTGKAITPKLEVKMKDVILEAGTDYEVSYSNNINAGTAKAQVVGIGKYEGVIDDSYEFEIEKKNLTDEDITVDTSNLGTLKFNGKSRTPIVLISYKGTNLSPMKDYDVVYSNNFYPGTATITMTGTGNFEGEIVKTFTITKMPISGVTIRTSFDTDNNLVVKVNNGSYGMTKGKDYSYTVATDSTGKITITFKGLGSNYEGTYVRTIAAEDNPNRPIAKVTKVKIKKYKVKAKKKTRKVRVSWLKLSDVTGYQVQYSTSKKFTAGKTTTVKKTSTKCKIKKLKKNKKYFVRVRAYRTINGKTRYGAWSATKKIKKVKVKKTKK